MLEAKKLQVQSRDRFELSVTIYNKGEEPAKGVVIVSHGFGEHTGKYVEFAEKLSDANYACAVFDQRGHGFFPGMSKKRRKKAQGLFPAMSPFWKISKLL